MTARLTAADVRIVLNERHELARRVMAIVSGRNREYVVDLNPAWSKTWLCTCGWAPNCAHIRATKEAIR